MTQDKEIDKIRRITELVNNARLNEALDLANDDTVLLVVIGILLIKRGDRELAERILDRVIHISPNDAKTWNMRGLALANLKKFEEALKCFDEAIKMNPSYSGAWHNKGTALGNMGRYEEALTCLDEAIKIDPKLVEAWCMKGNALGDLGRHEEALRCYDEAAKMNPDSADVWYNKGVELGRVGKDEEALRCYGETIRIDPNYAQAWYSKGVLLADLGRSEEAVECYNEAIEARRNYYEAWYSKGVELAKREEYEEALKCFEEAIAMNPNYAEAWSNKGVTLGNLAKYEEALICFNEALRINPNLPQAWYNKGTNLDILGRHEEALKSFDEATRISPSYPEAWCNKGVELGKLGRHEEALKSFGEALKANPRDALTFHNRGIALIYLYDYERAILDLRKAKEIFAERNMKTESDASREYESLAMNASKFWRQRVPTDAKEYSLGEPLLGMILGEMTGEIARARYSVQPMSTGVAKEIRIKPVFLEGKARDQVRVCLVQVDFSLTERFPYRLKEEEKVEVRKKVFDALDIAKKEIVDIICFPELSFAQEWVEETKRSCGTLLVVCGTYYDEYGYNVCRIIFNGKDYAYEKCHQSMFQREDGKGMKCGDNIFVFQTKFGKIAVATCTDLDEERHQLVKQSLDLVINPRFDIDKDYTFQRRADVEIERPDGSRDPAFVLQVNANTIKLGENIGGGGTAILGDEHKYRIMKYKDEGLRPKDELKHKLFQARGEMMLIADLNISQQTGVRTKTRDWYKYDGKGWKKLHDKAIWLERAHPKL